MVQYQVLLPTPSIESLYYKDSVKGVGTRSRYANSDGERKRKRVANTLSTLRLLQVYLILCLSCTWILTFILNRVGLVHGPLIVVYICLSVCLSVTAYTV